MDSYGFRSLGAQRIQPTPLGGTAKVANQCSFTGSIQGCGNILPAGRHAVVVVMMMCVVLLLVLLGLPLLLLTEREKDIADVVVFATCVVTCIFRRNKQWSVVEKHGFMTAGCGGLPWAASGCPGCRCGSLPV